MKHKPGEPGYYRNNLLKIINRWVRCQPLNSRRATTFLRIEAMPQASYDTECVEGREVSTKREQAATAPTDAAIRWWRVMGAVLATLLLASCQAQPAVRPYASGLNQPRGMAFDQAGNLYVAEAGAVDPHDDSSVRPIINDSSRVVRITPDGEMTTVLDGLPFTNYVTAGDIGASDVAVLDGILYVLIGEGYNDDLSRTVLRITPGGSPEIVFNIRHFVESTIPMDSLIGAGPSHASNPYAMTAAPDGQSFYISDGASGRVLEFRLDGAARVFAELPQMPPLTGLAFGPDGRLYVALFSELPLGPGKGAIWAADPAGELMPVLTGLTMPIDVGFDTAGTLYVLEFSDGGTAAQPAYVPNSGRLLRVEHNGAPTVVLERLNYPTALICARTGDLYLTVNGAFSKPGEGTILKVPCRSIGGQAACPPNAVP
jgi:hypothetical protein